jgi:threonylcarbamoyladenosine tRNA methylthiotransferase MtaB
MRRPEAGSRKPEAGSRKPEAAKCYDIPVPTFHVENFGCRATQADGAALERQFESRGLARAEKNDADFVILNTCTVTHSADQDARAAIRRLQRHNPHAKILVTGCYAQRAPEEIAALPGVTAVIGNSHKHHLAEIALREQNAPGDIVREGHDFSRAVQEQKSIAALAAEVDGSITLQSFVPLSTLTPNFRTPEAGRRKPEAALYISDIFAHTELLAAPVFEGEATENSRTRPNLKVQDGCDNRCSFCIIPSVRGQSRSLPMDAVIREVNALVAAGYKELVISGINLGRWGRDLGVRPPLTGFRKISTGYSSPIASQEKNLAREITHLPEARTRIAEAALHKSTFVSLLESILAETQLEKLRISSVEPMDWCQELIALVADSPRIARHAHVPLQSASDAVLRRMHRKYRPWHYREKIEKIHAAMPTAAIGADVMVGFPRESDAEFEATRRFIAELPFTYLHVFTYSARPGTPAAAMPDQVPVHVARERNKILRDLAAEKKQAFMQSFVGKTLQAITLGAFIAPSLPETTPALSSRAEPADSLANRSGAVEGPAFPALYTEALTDNYQKVYIPGTHQSNHWLTVLVTSVKDGAFIAGPIPTSEATQARLE